MKPSLIVHGGAWNIPDETVEDCRAGIRAALKAGWKILSTNGAAMDAAQAAIVSLEDDPSFDAGIGSHLNRDGRVQLSHDLDTVGAVALDSRGRLVAGTSTGGTCCKFPGRIGDSPLIGCGCYADVDAGGVSCTGHGEGIMKIVMAKMAADLLTDPQVFLPHRQKSDTCSLAQAVADACVRKLSHRAHTTGGLILLDRGGHPAAAFNTPRMAYGFVEPTGSFKIAP